MSPKYLRHLKSIQANFAGGVLGERSTLLELEYVLMACFKQAFIVNLKNTLPSSAFGGIHYLCLYTLTQESVVAVICRNVPTTFIVSVFES